MQKKVDKKRKRCCIPTNATPFSLECNTFSGESGPFSQTKELNLSSHRVATKSIQRWNGGLLTAAIAG